MSPESASEDAANTGRDHPFYSNTYNGFHCYDMGVPDRLSRIKTMDQQQLRKVLELPDIQRTVRLAAERRLWRLRQHEQF